MNKSGTKSSPNRQKDSHDTKTTPGTGNEAGDVGSMDKIRDILFGNQARDFERRFVHMEDHLVKETEGLREELRKRMDALETYMKKEMKALSERLKNETNDRTEEAKELRLEIKEASAALSKKIVLAEENFAGQATELRDQILHQSKQLSDEILEKFDHASKELRKTAQTLGDIKVNRSDLSGFFLDIAMRLSGDENLTSVPSSKD